MNKPIIMRDSPLAASIKTVTGWVSSNGRFFGDNEDLARYDGSTHQKCKNNPDHPIHEVRSYCEVCANENSEKRFREFEKKPWDGKTPVAIHETDEFFFSISDLFDHLCDHEIQLADVQIVHCKPQYPNQIDPGYYYQDDLPDGDSGFLSAALIDAFDKLNEVIKKEGPLCWYQDKFKVEFSSEQLSDFDKCWKETQEATAEFNA